MSGKCLAFPEFIFVKKNKQNRKYKLVLDGIPTDFLIEISTLKRSCYGCMFIIPIAPLPPALYLIPTPNPLVVEAIHINRICGIWNEIQGTERMNFNRRNSQEKLNSISETHQWKELSTVIFVRKISLVFTMFEHRFQGV